MREAQDDEVFPESAQPGSEPVQSATDSVTSPDLKRLIDDFSAEYEDSLISFRRKLHAGPELSFQEFATTDAVAERLTQAGLSTHRLPSGTGLFCDIGVAGTRVALRADLDALAMPDGKAVPYRSQNDGVAHACGHDVHTSIVLGAALVLSRLSEMGLLPGQLRVIFEPGEEQVPGGAVEVVELGLLRDIAMVFAVHCDPKLDVGVVGSRVGPITSAADRVEVTLHGPGGHTARPNLTVDLVALMARLIQELPDKLEARLGGPQNCRMVFGAAHAGDAVNVIPATAVVGGSLRTPDLVAWDSAPRALTESLEEILGDSGASWEVIHVRGVPPVTNDSGAAEIAAQCVQDLLGQDALVKTEHSWGGDSFGWMTKETRGAFLRLGTHDPKQDTRLDLHHSQFDVAEEAILIGVRLLCRTAVSALSELQESSSR